MKCLLKYQWVKLPRNQLPPGKGIMGMWARLAFRAAFRIRYNKFRKLKSRKRDMVCSPLVE